MTDIAALGLKIDTMSLKEAVDLLPKFVKGAKDAETAQRELERQSARAAQQQANQAKMLADVAVAEQRLAQAKARTTREEAQAAAAIQGGITARQRAARAALDVEAAEARLDKARAQAATATARQQSTELRLSEQRERSSQRAASATAAEAMALERLRSKYDPLFAAQSRYRREVEEINRLHMAGAISSQQHLTALARSRASLQVSSSSPLGGSTSSGLGDGGILGSGAIGRVAGGVIIAQGVVQGVRQLKEMTVDLAMSMAQASDRVAMMSGRLNVLTGASLESRDAFNQVYAVAQRLGAPIGDVSDAVSRLALAGSDFGATSKDVITATDTILKLGRVGNSTQQQIAAGTMQLSQALASGRLNGDELRSVLENIPAVARVIAKEYGVSVGELRKMGSEGQLAADRIFAALLKGNADATRQFQQMPQTVEQAATRSANAATLVTAEISKWLGLSDFFVGKLNQAATLMEVIGKGTAALNNPDFIDRQAAAAIDRDLPGLRAKRDAAAAAGPGGRALQAITGETSTYYNELIAQLESRRRQIDARMADRAYDAGIAGNEQTFGAMSRAAAAEETRRKAAIGEVDKIRVTYDPALKIQREMTEARQKYDAAVKAGAITQAQATAELAKYERHLRSTGAAGKTTAASLQALQEVMQGATFSKELADRAYDGAAALAEIEAKAQAAKKAMDVFNGKRDPVFEGRYAGALLDDRNEKLRGQFRTDTVQSEREVALLERQLQLVGERPEIVAREIALLRVRQDIEARGISLSDDDIERRVRSVEKQELLTRRLEESRQAQQAMVEPWRNAEQSLQAYAVDVLTEIPNSWAEAANRVGSIWKRLMAELAVASIIRPFVLQPAMSALSSLGIVPSQVAAQYGVSGGSGYSGGSGGGSSLFSSFGGGGGGFNPFGMFGSNGSIGGFLSSPISGFPSAAAFEGVIPGMSGSSAQSYFNGASGGGMFGTTTWGQGLGALAGVGSSIFSFASGNPIGGATGLLGAGLSLIPGMQWAGPVVGILGSVLGGLFKKKPDIKAQGVHDYDFASGLYGSRVPFSQGVAAPLAPGVGNDALKLLGAFGGSVTPGMAAPSYYLWRGFDDGRMDASVTVQSPTYARLMAEEFASGVTNVDQAQWQARRNLWTDDGSVNLPISGLTTDSDKLMQQLALMILKAGVRDGAFTGLSGTSQSIIRNFPDASTQGLSEALQWGKGTYDVMRRVDPITALEQQITQLTDSFDAAIMKAKEYRLETDELTAARARQIKKVADDWAGGIDDRLLGLTDPMALELKNLEKAKKADLDQDAYLTKIREEGLVDTLSRVNQIEEYYGLRRRKIVEQYTGDLVAFEQRLRFGDLSATNPTRGLAGQLASYYDLERRALGGDQDALSRFQASAEATLARQAQFGGYDTSYYSLRDQVAETTRRIIAGDVGDGTSAASTALAQIANQQLDSDRLTRELIEKLAVEFRRIADKVA